MVTAAALIVAAGRGHRVGGPLPKQYRHLAGRAVLGYSVRRFATHPRIGRVRVVINPDDRTLYDDAVEGQRGRGGGQAAQHRSQAVRRGRTRCGTASKASPTPRPTWC